MGLFIKPQKLSVGDTVATVSLSGGRAGDSDMVCRYAIGKQRLEQIFGLKVVEMPNSMKGTIKDIILKVLHEEGLTSLPVFSGVEFSHSNPMAVLPIGVDVEVDCDNKTITVLESGVC